MILCGTTLSDKMAVDLRVRATGRNLRMAIILVGEDVRSVRYVSAKQKRAAEIGVVCDIIKIDENVPESEVLEVVNRMNGDKNVHGVMVQLPLPNHMCARKICAAVCPDKDIDGLNPASKFMPATVRGIEIILENYYNPHPPAKPAPAPKGAGKIPLQGKNVIVVGRGMTVGAPAKEMLRAHGADVSVIHTKTENPREIMQSADLIISAAGIKNLIKPDDIKDGVVLIDAGTFGDVHPDCYKKAAAYTPVPGGVGPMTIISLLDNLVISNQ
ncbi:MAG: bifunctional 5,10-methylenetetrahydrofolate dehydrogenase/5,10-methenyltetrahydrofolate cyclohydrolase [Alphaproteobacteria bacterium]|nr:bifunctional 5,10-methylenetetrahydrofolate dehydrogenase/5,10-methenyltetrahydrofolate cyclohydrolase [Alphaproteobacteria bacterium]